MSFHDYSALYSSYHFYIYHTLLLNLFLLSFCHVITGLLFLLLPILVAPIFKCMLSLRVYMSSALDCCCDHENLSLFVTNFRLGPIQCCFCATSLYIVLYLLGIVDSTYYNIHLPLRTIFNMKCRNLYSQNYATVHVSRLGQFLLKLPFYFMAHFHIELLVVFQNISCENCGSTLISKHLSVVAVNS